MEVRVLFSGTDRLYHTTSREFFTVECASCGLLRLDPWPTPAELGRYYPPGYWFDPGEDSSGWLAERYRRFVLADHVRFVQRAVEESGETGTVLDVGCGGGLFLRMLRERGFRVAGLDFALGAAHTAWNANGVPALCGSLARAPIAASSCAAVTMFHVMEHLFDPLAYLDQAHRILKPDGRLIVQVPNAACWQFLLFGEHWNGVDIPRHLIHFKVKDLDGLLDYCGFEVLRHKHFSWRDNPAGLATTLAPGLDPMARRIRGIEETPRRKLFRDLLYFGIVLGCVPLTLLEAACGQGSTIRIEARKKR
jgi:SAM-dependent methyltransferase